MDKYNNSFITLKTIYIIELVLVYFKLEELLRFKIDISNLAIGVYAKQE